MRAIVASYQSSPLLNKFIANVTFIDNTTSPQTNLGVVQIPMTVDTLNASSDIRGNISAAISAWCTANSVTVPSSYFYGFDSEIVPAGNTTGFATVATTGSYNDLINQPIIPTAAYSSYQSLISQTGTSAPTGSALHSDFGATTFTWARVSAGVYTLTASSGVFTANKTGIFIKPLNNLNGALSTVVTSTTVITVTTAVQSLAVLGLLGFTATPTDALLVSTLLEVRVYP